MCIYIYTNDYVNVNDGSNHLNTSNKKGVKCYMVQTKSDLGKPLNAAEPEVKQKTISERPSLWVTSCQPDVSSLFIRHLADPPEWVQPGKSRHASLLGNHKVLPQPRQDRL